MIAVTGDTVSVNAGRQMPTSSVTGRAAAPANVMRPRLSDPPLPPQTPTPSPSATAMGALLSIPFLAVPAMGSVWSIAASCCGAATCSAVMGSCGGKCGNRYVSRQESKANHVEDGRMEVQDVCSTSDVHMGTSLMAGSQAYLVAKSEPDLSMR
jgi:hypothetical protein